MAFSSVASAESPSLQPLNSLHAQYEYLPTFEQHYPQYVDGSLDDTYDYAQQRIESFNLTTTSKCQLSS
uniref:Uncharacterized protein n=1 Tax=Paenibacillus athensensis TaxID=1967502 RepID=A0A4Y8Q3M8_9BACL